MSWSLESESRDPLTVPAPSLYSFGVITAFRRSSRELCEGPAQLHRLVSAEIRGAAYIERGWKGEING